MERIKDKAKIKLIDKIGKDSFVINKYGTKFFSFSYFRDKMKENNITEDELSILLLDAKLLKETNMPIKEFTQWIFNPTEDLFIVESYLNDITPSELSSKLSSLSSSSSFSSSSSEQYPPFTS